MSKLLRTLFLGLGCWFIGETTALQADEAVDRWLGERLRKTVNIDAERDDHLHLLEKLSTAIGVPIDVDKHSLMLLGITRCASISMRQGDKPAIELLTWLTGEIGRDDRVTFIVTDDEQKRTPQAVRILVVSRESLAKHDAIVPANHLETAEEVMEERLARSISLPVERDTLAGHLERLTAKVELPIELDSKSVEQGITPNPSFASPSGEMPAIELLAAFLKAACPDRCLACYLADDAQKRTPDEVRIVIAARSVLESNPARFTSPASRPTKRVGLKMSKILAHPVNLVVADQPLSSVLDSLTKQAGTKFDWDYEAAWKGELNRGKFISVNAINQPLGVALQQVLADASVPNHPLVFTVWRVSGEGEKLIVTSRTSAARKGWQLPEAYEKPTTEK